MISIDTLAYTSPLRQKSPALKTAFATGSLLICVAAGSFAVSCCILIVMGILTVGIGKIPLQRYQSLMLIPLGFLLLGTLAVVFSVSGQPNGIFVIPLGHVYLTASASSLLYGLRLICTSLAAVSCLYFLSLTTPITDLLSVLRRAHCPALLLELMFLVYRFLFVLLETASHIRTAQKCRLGMRDQKTALKSAGLLLAVLLEQAFFRSNRLYDAMESRCFDGELRVLSRTSRATGKEIGLAVFFLFLFGALAVFSRMTGGIG